MLGWVGCRGKEAGFAAPPQLSPEKTSSKLYEKRSASPTALIRIDKPLLCTVIGSG